MRVIATIAAVLMLAGCSSGATAVPPAAPAVTVTATATPTGPDLVACRAAIGKNYETGWERVGADPWPPATREPVCSGIDRPTLQRLVNEALDDSMNGTAGPG